jgi:hypothetical protein
MPGTEIEMIGSRATAAQKAITGMNDRTPSGI